ncbi:hypothetical protein HYH02_014146 [Chlamydomonas schloesseri]|uniref:Uncharacterized protein n=1 Tax=Chlamydomonas schloesseri TaxID=2026947 RepID=A0A835ST06_9CHLO|nr:hypothetical protein HYH02_014146 [Chlamydomonas schloesseri]|eukprot:KAG2429108.1 hypothetical protein HYH02_014146 [Chlamydomonas schloesseri]
MTQSGAAPDPAATAAVTCQTARTAHAGEQAPPPHQHGAKQGRGRVGKPLWQVVEQVQDEWFEEEMEEARGGNPVSMALVGQMLIQGYGCARDLAAGRDWVARALDTAQGKSDYAHLLGSWRALWEAAEAQPVLSRRGGRPLE